MPGPFDRHFQHLLMFVSHSRNTSWYDLAFFRHELPQKLHVLIVYFLDLGKRYRIGKSLQQAQRRNAIVRKLLSPFQYLIDTLREPDPDEVLWAIKGISFDVDRGDVVGIIGRNGAGKSTLLKVLSLITEPTEGRALIHGRIGSLLEVGTGFHPELTGRENIYLSGAIMGMKKIEINQNA